MTVLTRLLLVLCLVALAAPPARAQDPTPPDPANPVVVVQTNLGDITIELFKDKAPLTVANFLNYANSGFYAGTIFHRVIRGFMVQGGGLTPQLRQKKTNPPIRNEATNRLRNDRGTVAAARTMEINSATSQFFINTASNTALNYKSILRDEFGYAVFGRVIDGMAVVDTIEKLKTNGANVPQSLAMITRVYVKEPQ
jgi:peptidyl-prolyl cis-trans isomerase B (cyclophilin B)